jgi:hypothetical protein
MKDTESMSRDLIEGVRLYPPDTAKFTSVLLNPDRARPLFHIAAESEDPKTAELLAEEYVKKMKQWIHVG